jgi:hypothetical protein
MAKVETPLCGYNTNKNGSASLEKLQVKTSSVF